MERQLRVANRLLIGAMLLIPALFSALVFARWVRWREFMDMAALTTMDRFDFLLDADDGTFLVIEGIELGVFLHSRRTILPFVRAFLLRGAPSAAGGGPGSTPPLAPPPADPS